MKTLRKWTVVMALMISIATPWTLLQSAAWFGMFIRYSKDATLSKAIEMTFDGKHPCRLCTIAQEGKKQEREQPKKQGKSDEKLQLGMPLLTVFLFRSSPPERPAAIAVFPGIRNERPPVPPPRS